MLIMCLCNLWRLSVFLTCFCVVFVTTFNVDSFNYAAYEDVHSSMFGFSIALHKEGPRGWLIVGAPEAQSSYQRDVYRGGVVYKCPVQMDGHCEEIPFDPYGNVIENGEIMDNKTERWFGATISSSGRAEGPIVACAPRYTWYPRKKSRRDPVGTCYVSDGMFRKFDEYSPCRTYQWGYHRQGSCQAGFSAAINSIGDRLFIGSPGSWYWQGQMYSIDAHAKFAFKPSLFSATYGSEGQVHQQSLTSRPAVVATKERTEKDDDTYMGYSTIVGNFTDDGEEGIAVGMPRGNNLRGKVILFSWNLTDLINHFSSDQLGSYFGYALAASDVDGDKKVDLIIGAPMYTLQNNEDKYDVGRVYVIYQNHEKGKFVAQYTIDGFNSKSRFGQALASLGDINQDGYGDFAVGAPYDGPDYRGAVYIYHGSKKGVREKFSQAIFAEDISPGPFGNLRTFGFSVTGGMDLDNNKYPDMAVGAYLSNKAYFFRSRPVIKAEASVKFLTENKEIIVEKSNHRLLDGTPATTTKIQVCVSYSGEGIPDTLDLHRQIILDRKKSISRMGFVQNESLSVLNETLTLTRNGHLLCNVKDVYVRSDISDKLTALVVEVKHWMKDDLRSYEMTRDPRSVLRPTLDFDSAPIKRDSINIHKNCRNQTLCIPSLSLKADSNVKRYLLDSKKPLVLNIVVSNTGDDSFETSLDVKHSENIFFHNLVSERVVSRVLCSSDPDNHTVHCEIGNPIPKDNIVKFQLQWQPNYKKKGPTYDFFISVNSINNDLSPIKDQSVKNISVDLWANSRHSIDGKSILRESYFNSSRYNVDISNQSIHTPSNERLSEETIGPEVVHIFYLKNEGVTEIEESEVFFAWPAFTLSGEDFVYLLEPPEFSQKKNVECEPMQANYRDFAVIKSRKPMSERYEISSKTDSEINTVSAAVGGGPAKKQPSVDEAVASAGDISTTQEERIKAMKQQNMSSTETFQNSSYTHITQYRNYSTITEGGKIMNNQSVNTIDITSGGGGRINSTPSGEQTVSESEEVTKSSSIDQHSFGAGGGTTVRNESYVFGGRGGGVTIMKNQTFKNLGILQIFNGQEQQSGRYRYFLFRGNRFFYRCISRTNGEEEEVNCGRNFIFPTEVIVSYLEQYGFQQIGSIHYRCLENVNDAWYSINCGYPPTYQQIGGSLSGGSVSGGSVSGGSVSGGSVSGGSVSGGSVSGGSVSGGSSYGGINIIRKCHLQHANGETVEIDCNDKRYQSAMGGSTFNQKCWHVVQGRRYPVSCDAVSNFTSRYSYGGSQVNQQVGSDYNTNTDRYDQRSRPVYYQGGSQYNQQSQTGSHQQNSNYNQRQGTYQLGGYGNAYDNRNASYYNQHGGSTVYQKNNNIHDDDIYDDEEENGKSISDYINPSNYGNYGGQRSGEEIQESGLGAAALGNNQYRTVALDLSDVGSRYGQQYSNGGNRQWQQKATWSETKQISPSYNNVQEIGRDNVPTDRPMSNRQSHGRKKRRISQNTAADLYPCRTVRCLYMTCTIKNLKPNVEIAVALRGRINAQVLKNVNLMQPLSFSSVMAARIHKLQHIGTPTDQEFRFYELNSTISAPETELKPSIVPLWVVVLSAVAGTLILLLLVFLLYKLGFFKRNRPSSAPERQPLNRNGYHHGDEAL